MRRFYLFCWIFCFFYAPTHSAQMITGNASVATFVQNTLISTLKLNPETLKTHFNATESLYSKSAWQGLSDFLGRTLNTVEDEKLTLNPEVQGAANIIESDNIANLQYWQVAQLVRVPELNRTFNFFVVVMKKDTSYIIQSLNVTESWNFLNWPYWY